MKITILLILLIFASCSKESEIATCPTVVSIVGNDPVYSISLDDGSVFFPENTSKTFKVGDEYCD